MACSSNGQNIILVQANAAVASFEAILPALTAAGTIGPTEAANLTTYVNTATTTLQTVVSELQSGTSTLPKIAAVIQNIVTAYNTVAAGLTPSIAPWVNTANAGVQALLAAIQAEINQLPKCLPSHRRRVQARSGAYSANHYALPFGRRHN